MQIEELIKRSGDAEFVSLTIREFKAVVNLKLEDDEEFSLVIETNYLSFFDVSKSTNPCISNCHVEVLKIADFLTVQNGIYVPAADFGSLMKEAKRGLNLAYGKSAKDSEWLFVVKGYENLFVCVIKNPSSISIRKV